MALLAQQGFSRGPKRFPKVSKAATTVPQSIPKGAIIGLLDQQGFSSGPKRSQASYNDSQQQQQQKQQPARDLAARVSPVGHALAAPAAAPTAVAVAAASPTPPSCPSATVSASSLP